MACAGKANLDLFVNSKVLSTIAKGHGRYVEVERAVTVSEGKVHGHCAVVPNHFGDFGTGKDAGER